MAITVHHLNNSRSHRVLWALEELGLGYDIRKYTRDPRTQLAPSDLEEVHPLGKSPVLTDGDLTLAESGAILEYLVERYGEGRLRPAAGTPERLRYTYWMHYAEGSLMPLLLVALITGRIERAPLLVRPIAKGIASQIRKGYLRPNLQRHLDYVEQSLGESTWFAGEELTAADIQMSFPLEVGAARAGSGTSRPRIAAFLERMRARPPYQRAVERGGELEAVT